MTQDPLTLSMHASWAHGLRTNWLFYVLSDIFKLVLIFFISSFLKFGKTSIAYLMFLPIRFPTMQGH